MLTVLMATFNGAKTLPAVLEAYTHLVAPEGGWKVVVVDNGSVDDTKQIVQGYTSRLPLTYLYEPKKGKNAALNHGLTVIEGDLIVLTDDDATPLPDWLCKLRQGANANASFAIFGGAIIPQWEQKPDNWILTLVPLGITYALTAPDLPEGPIFPGLVWGPNMAVRKEVFDAGHRFDEGVGPNGANYVMGSETEFTLRVSNAGFKSWFCKEAVVSHFIRATQMEKAWILKRASRFGRNMYRQEVNQGPFDVPTFLGVPRWRVRKLVNEWAKSAHASLVGQIDEAFRANWEVYFLRGYFYEAWRRRRDNK
jgi:glycosyltransferase involved in cell wall biosynthesis